MTKLYNRVETFKSLFSNHHEIHSFGYGALGWLLANALPAVEPTIKIGVLGVVATLYGYDICSEILPVDLKREDLPVDIRKQKHYFVLGVAAAVALELLFEVVIPSIF